MNYLFQHRIETLAHNAVMNESQASSFTEQEICFSHWDFNFRDGWSQNFWLAKGDTQANNLNEAYKRIREQLIKIVPRIALIGQSYIDFITQPVLVHREDRDFAFLSYVADSEAVGLMFMENERKALRMLIDDSQIPEEFFFYWNDAVNTTGYSSKLLLMFSAIEAMVKTNAGRKDFAKLEQILGNDLKTELWGSREDSQGALRHRLVHGEYFEPGDSGRDYVELIHKKIIDYFNGCIFGETLLSENVKHPQRHFFVIKSSGMVL